MKDLKSCPCCEDEPFVIFQDGLISIKCDGCELQTRFGIPEEICDAWNKRADNDEENERQRGDEQFDRAERSSDRLEQAEGLIADAIVYDDEAEIDWLTDWIASAKKFINGEEKEEEEEQQPIYLVKGIEEMSDEQALAMATEMLAHQAEIEKREAPTAREYSCPDNCIGCDCHLTLNGIVPSECEHCMNHEVKKDAWKENLTALMDKIEQIAPLLEYQRIEIMAHIKSHIHMEKYLLWKYTVEPYCDDPNYFKERIVYGKIAAHKTLHDYQSSLEWAKENGKRSSHDK